MGNVVKLETYRARGMVESLETLLAGAKQGRLTGLAIAWHCRNGKHGQAIVGDYKDDPIRALGAVSKLWGEVNEQTKHPR